jgi:Bacterial regulatory proteins, tetR family
MTRYDTHQKLWSRTLGSNLEGAQGTRQGHSPADVRQDGQIMRTERESKKKDTHKLIVEVAVRLFRQIGFQKTTVADIARELCIPALTRSIMCLLRRQILLWVAQPHRQAPAPEPA